VELTYVGDSDRYRQASAEEGGPVEAALDLFAEQEPIPQPEAGSVDEACSQFESSVFGRWI